MLKPVAGLRAPDMDVTLTGLSLFDDSQNCRPLAIDFIIGRDSHSGDRS